MVPAVVADAGVYSVGVTRPSLGGGGGAVWGAVCALQECDDNAAIRRGNGTKKSSREWMQGVQISTHHYTVHSNTQDMTHAAVSKRYDTYLGGTFTEAPASRGGQQQLKPDINSKAAAPSQVMSSATCKA
jgi:hypothetical protein